MDTLYVGNLVMREFYIKDGMSFTYIKEPMVISKVINNKYPMVFLRSIASIENTVATVSKYNHKLIYVDEKWIASDDIINGNINISEDKNFNLKNVHCEQLLKVTLADVKGRYAIIDNVVIEDDGKISNREAALMDIPAWC